MYQACCAALTWPLAGMELRGSGAKSVLRAHGPLTQMRFQNHRHRSFVLTAYDLLTRRRPTLGYLTLSGCCQSWISIIFFPRFHCPECPGHFISQRNCDHLAWLSQQHGIEPG